MIFKTLKADLYRHGALTGFTGFIKGLLIPGFRYVAILRIASQFKRRSILGIFFRIILRHYSYKFGYQIPVTTKIGKGFYIGHTGTLIINAQAVIGDNCNIAPLVTIGQTNRGALIGTPQIGNKVWIGTGSVLVGNINIGSNVLIAPNSFVNIDIPSNSIVIGNPAKVISNSAATMNYIENLIDE